MTEAVLRARRTIPQRDRGAHQERAEADTRAHLRIASRPGPRRAGRGASQARVGAPRCRRADHRRSGAGAAPRALAGRGNPALRNRAGGSLRMSSSTPRPLRRLSGVEAHVGHIVIEVRDNGRGFDPGAANPGHFGLDSMRSRARPRSATRSRARPASARSSGSGPGDEWRLTSSSRPATRASAC